LAVLSARFRRDSSDVLRNLCRIRVADGECLCYRVKMTRAFVVAAALLLAVPAADAQRLPTTVVPEHYTLWVAPDIATRSFRGRETIDVQVASPTTAITLNAAEIEFSSVTIASGGRTQTARVTTDAAQERATFTVPQWRPSPSPIRAS
jgi:hypothetical protein